MKKRLEWDFKRGTEFRKEADLLVAQVFEDNITIDEFHKAINALIPNNVVYVGRWFSHGDETLSKKEIIKRYLQNFGLELTYTERLLVACVKRHKHDLAKYIYNLEEQ